MDLIFTRDRAFYFTTVFIPGIILVTSSFITFWLEWNAVPARSMIGNDRTFSFGLRLESGRPKTPIHHITTFLWEHSGEKVDGKPFANTSFLIPLFGSVIHHFVPAFGLQNIDGSHHHWTNPAHHHFHRYLKNQPHHPHNAGLPVHFPDFPRYCEPCSMKHQYYKTTRKPTYNRDFRTL